jgi:Fe-S-cluster-containing hydrogenase component 2
MPVQFFYEGIAFSVREDQIDQSIGRLAQRARLSAVQRVRSTSSTCIGCSNCAIACPYDNIAMIDTPTFDRAQARKTRIMSEPNFFWPYPVASHDVGEQGLLQRLFGHGRNRARKRKPVAVTAHHDYKHVPVAFPIKCDLCDGLPFMGCVHSCPTVAAIRIDPEKLFEQTGALCEGSRVRKARGSSD